jgi:hypothetical protein
MGNGVDMEFRELWENIVDGVRSVTLLSRYPVGRFDLVSELLIIAANGVKGNLGVIIGAAISRAFTSGGTI